MSGQNVVHKWCYSYYTDLRNIHKTTGVGSSVDDILYSDDGFEHLPNVVEEKNGIGDICAFNFAKLCFICSKNCSKSTNFNKTCTIKKGSSIVNDIRRACSQRNDVVSNEVHDRIEQVDLFSVGAQFHECCFSKFITFADCSVLTQARAVAGVQQMATLPAWIIDGGTIPVNNHHDCLRLLGLNNGMEIVNTISGGSCFFDAVRQCALQFGLVRSVEQLRVAAALELQRHSQQYRPLYVVEDHGQFVQAPTYDLFVDRTANGVEWATAMTVAAMAVAIGIPIKVISTATNANGLITAYQIDNAEGVNYANEMIVVGYNSATAHYVGFRSANFNTFLQVEQDLSADFRNISCFDAPKIDSNDDDVPMLCGNSPRHITYYDDEDDDDDDDMSICDNSTFGNEEAEFFITQSATTTTLLIHGLYNFPSSE